MSLCLILTPMTNHARFKSSLGLRIEFVIFIKLFSMAFFVVLNLKYLMKGVQWSLHTIYNAAFSLFLFVLSLKDGFFFFLLIFTEQPLLTKMRNPNSASFAYQIRVKCNKMGCWTMISTRYTNTVIFLVLCSTNTFLPIFSQKLI